MAIPENKILHVHGDTENRIKTPVDYINDLIQQIKDDVYPLFFFTPGAAPFTILRNLLCFLDHVARLRFGNETDSLTKLFEAEEFGAYQFIRRRYRELSPFLIQMYRHELVHHVRPFRKKTEYKIMKGDGSVRETGFREFGFHISSDINAKLKNRNEYTFDGVIKFLKSEDNRSHFCHLRSVRDADGEYVNFVFNTFCFLGDVVDYLDKYNDRLDSSGGESANFLDNFHKISSLNEQKPSSPLVLDNYFATRAMGSDTDLSHDEINSWYETARKELYKTMFD